MCRKFLCLLILIFLGCAPAVKKKETVLYEAYCASCHIAPKINSLPKHIWDQNVLPDMAARLGILENSYNPYAGMPYNEMEILYNSGIYPTKPLISRSDWQMLRTYIMELAPDSLPVIEDSIAVQPLTQFTLKKLKTNEDVGSMITHLDYDKEINKLVVGDIYGNLFHYDIKDQTSMSLGNYGSAIVSQEKWDSTIYTTTIGRMPPSEIANGQILETAQEGEMLLPNLHRPVHTTVFDFNKDEIEELVVSEFGDKMGELSLFSRPHRDSSFSKKVLLSQPGAIKSVVKDMNADGLEDLVVMTTQADESITILYQESPLKFRVEKVIRFSPVYGSSWFELLDFDGDGDQDVITVNGDNADRSYVHKPYHGLRIHINDGSNTFEEMYFYPMHGATRLVASDYDQDGDIDFGIVATFPDYQNRPQYSFIYLENHNEKSFEFIPHLLPEGNEARWFLAVSEDIDGDGDEDIVLSAFTYAFTPVPEEQTNLWNDRDIDILVLENTLMNK